MEVLLYPLVVYEPTVGLYGLTAHVLLGKHRNDSMQSANVCILFIHESYISRSTTFIRITIQSF